jgi:hypothetical protein
MKRKIFISLIPILLITYIVLTSNCTTMTKNTITGNWKLTSVLSAKTNQYNNLVFDFEDGVIYVSDSDLKLCQVIKYTFTNNLIININNSTSEETVLANEAFNVYYFNNEMIWYFVNTGAECYRFVKK